jgi:hypothetical protein
MLCHVLLDVCIISSRWMLCHHGFCFICLVGNLALMYSSFHRSSRLGFETEGPFLTTFSFYCCFGWSRLLTTFSMVW